MTKATAPLPAMGGSFIREADGTLNLIAETAEPVVQEEPESRPEKAVKAAVKPPLKEA